MSKVTPPMLHRALYRLLRPLARLMLRNGVSFGEFSELARRAYVQSALEDFSDSQVKATDSRAAVLTGLTRKEVKRQRDILAGEKADSRSGQQGHRASRVVSGWVHDAAFQNDTGEPSDLAADGPLSFAELVRRYSGDMTPRAVLDELLRVGMVKQETPDGKIRLVRKAYVPAGDSEEALQIFGEDTADLIRTIDHNLMAGTSGEVPLFQRTLVYDNIPPEVMARWRKHAAAQSQALLEQLDQWLAPRDRDMSGQSGHTDNGNPVRTGVGIFYFEDPVQPGDIQQ